MPYVRGHYRRGYSVRGYYRRDPEAPGSCGESALIILTLAMPWVMIPLLLIAGLCYLIGLLCHIAYDEFRAWRKGKLSLGSVESGLSIQSTSALTFAVETPTGSVEAAVASVPALRVPLAESPVATKENFAPSKVESHEAQHSEVYLGIPRLVAPLWKPGTRVYHAVLRSGIIESAQIGSVSVDFHDYGVHNLPSSQLTRA